MARRFLTAIDMTNNRVTNVGDPSSAQDAATKNYVDSTARGLTWKTAVRASPVGNVNIASPGGTFDGVTMAAGNRVLLKDQTAGAQNGIYVWNGAASAMTRAVDADTSAKVTSGLAVTVTEGTANGDKAYNLTTDDPITLGTTSLAFSPLGGGSGTTYTAGNGLTLSGSSFAVNAGSGVIADGSSTRIDPSVVVRKYSTNVGDGSSTGITVTHNLGTRDVQVTVYATATPWDSVDVDVERPDTNSVTLRFATAPAAGAYRAVVFA